MLARRETSHPFQLASIARSKALHGAVREQQIERRFAMSSTIRTEEVGNIYFGLRLLLWVYYLVPSLPQANGTAHFNTPSENFFGINGFTS